MYWPLDICFDYLVSSPRDQKETECSNALCSYLTGDSRWFTFFLDLDFIWLKTQPTCSSDALRPQSPQILFKVDFDRQGNQWNHQNSKLRWNHIGDWNVFRLFFRIFFWKILHFPKKSVNIFGNFCAWKKYWTILWIFFT